MHVATEILWNIAEKPKEQRSDSIIDRCTVFPPVMKSYLFIIWFYVFPLINKAWFRAFSGKKMHAIYIYWVLNITLLFEINCLMCDFKKKWDIIKLQRLSKNLKF
jgi:hypothetical protein